LRPARLCPATTAQTDFKVALPPADYQTLCATIKTYRYS
jgi:hypothetical protein